ncbi:Phosphate ABC transport system, periplasmic binding protein [Nitrospina gracilis 3/211]|uniref:Phosphate-binding protein n=1 Tax=Nitrospina gracilis (strain 3/211) TaxID=1266370 RepID=M1Z932_NITG3|nr:MULTISPECIES: PstS family phosphate ABC transporter substrate-binding protein [Nitrospina]MCF8722680.1 phosphate transport system substrate-binding protein [Nitrospina sp. Nb-3]CCQ89621.1 Phosphate ABC transport system, periplasmic binding protein [Nitrospina gracilis 3/211]
MYRWIPRILMVALVLSASSFALADEKLRGTVRIDGSSTVFPISEAVAEEFSKNRDYARVRVTVGVSGTGGGFKKFTAGEIDINNASRPIKQNEIDRAKKNNLRYLELPIANDGLSVVINQANTWVDYLTTDELKKIWEPGSSVKTWADVRDGWPDKALRLYGPGTDSGTFDYFTETINGKSQASRADFTKSEDDNMLVKGVSGDKYALGFFGFAYFVENQDILKAVPIKEGSKDPVLPTVETINQGTYSPLSRPVFIYVNVEAAMRPEAKAFIRFYLENAGPLSKEAGYIPLLDSMYRKNKERFESDLLKLAKN